jgi:hypothetical protein
VVKVRDGVLFLFKILGTEVPNRLLVYKANQPRSWCFLGNHFHSHIAISESRQVQSYKRLSCICCCIYYICLIYSHRLLSCRLYYLAPSITGAGPSKTLFGLLCRSLAVHFHGGRALMVDLARFELASGPPSFRRNYNYLSIYQFHMLLRTAAGMDSAEHKVLGVAKIQRQEATDTVAAPI